MSIERIRIKKGDDLHCHLKLDEILNSVVGFTARQFKRATIMPNTIPPILTAQDALWYREAICKIAPWFEPRQAVGYLTALFLQNKNAHSGVFVFSLSCLGFS